MDDTEWDRLGYDGKTRDKFSRNDCKNDHWAEDVANELVLLGVLRCLGFGEMFGRRPYECRKMKVSNRISFFELVPPSPPFFSYFNPRQKATPRQASPWEFRVPRSGGVFLDTWRRVDRVHVPDQGGERLRPLRICNPFCGWRRYVVEAR